MTSKLNITIDTGLIIAQFAEKYNEISNEQMT